MMGVSQVIRGVDLVPSTPRQILLYRALGWHDPRFGHVPLAVTPDGRRLAKRDGSIKLATLQRAGRRSAPTGRRAWSGLAVGRSCSCRLGPPTGSVRFDPEALPREPGSLLRNGFSRLARTRLRTG